MSDFDIMPTITEPDIAGRDLSLIGFAHRLADASGDIIRRYYRQSPGVEIKADESPVTVADTEVERVLRSMIREEYPEHGIVGEEFGVNNESAEYKWILDPIDGTLSFMIGRPIFGTLIALVRGNKPIIGLIDQPIINERWSGTYGKPATWNNQKAQTSMCADLSEAILATTAPDLFTNQDLRLFATVANKVRHTVYGGDCYNYALLASGKIDVVLESGLKPHDFCALVPVIEAAGGIVTDWHGRPITLESDGRILACGSQHIHRSIIEMFNKTRQF